LRSSSNGLGLISVSEYSHTSTMGEFIYKSPVKEHARDNHTEMIADDAAELVVELAEEFADEVLEAGSEYRDAADRITLYKEDVEKAVKRVDIG